MAKWILKKAPVLALCAVFALGGCGGSSTGAPVNVVGQWFGDLTLALFGVGDTEGFLTLELDQVGGAVGGSADWAPIDAKASLTGEVTENTFEFRFFTRCPGGSEEFVLSGSVDSGVMTITGADGEVCIKNALYRVLDGQGVLDHEADDLPL